ncbi:MAG: nucleotide exchange factor GrpE [Parcubacteria group bacterium]|nr:nucleotide exchange factor GrpE [Parcubacteria group bacterium]
MSDETDNNSDEVQFEETDEGGEASSFRDKEKKLREKLAQCEKERQEYLDGWQRAKADFINARKAEDESRKTLREFVKEDILSQILPVLDSFELAFRNKEAWERADKGWREGVEHIYTQLIGILKSNSILEINPVGAHFDPNKHESVETVETDREEDDGKILEVTQRGYELNGRLLRPARVKISEFKKQKS